MVRFHALGSVTITGDDRELAVGGPRQRRLLAVLLVHRNSVVSTDRLADVVFAGEPTPAASTTLRSYVARVRRVINGADGIGVVTQAPGYRLQLPDDAFDVARFETMVGEGRGLSVRGDAIGAASVLRRALGEWRGDAYAEFADEEWARPEAQRLGELRLAAHEELFDAELSCGRAADLVPEIESLARQHPLRERVWSLLMLAFYRAGRQADALRAFQEHRAALVEELGLDPGRSLRELEVRILAQDPGLLLDEPIGTPLRGYRLGERLGTGHDGTVSVAHLPGVEREIVIRVVRAEVADDPDFVRTFESNTQRVAALRHEAIVPIVDYWREPGGAYVVMRRVRGGSLADRLGRGRLRDDELAELTRRVGSALVSAAEVGLVHGRVCSNSVLYDDKGRPFLSDFALVPGGSSPADDVRALAALLSSATGHAHVRDAAAGAATGSMAELVAAAMDALASDSAHEPFGAPNPYKGLRAFHEADAADFFGRDCVVEEVLHRLDGDEAANRLVLVVGGSGTGKSSVVRAGLLPRLRAGAIPRARDWYVATMLPGPAPFKELAESLEHVAIEVDPDLIDALGAPGGLDEVLRRLLPPNAQLLLVVDQLEELFTTSPEADQRAFLEGLVQAIEAPDSRLRVVCTLRADFFDRPLGVQGFGAAVSEATVTIPVMSPAELEAAIVEPARRAGRVVEGALVAELVDAVAHEPAALPSLQFTLFELAEASSGDLTLAAYRELGGVTGAITSRAEQLYRSLEDDERAAVRRVFERLVVINPDGEATRRPAARAELVRDEGAASVGAVIDRWADARLLSLDRQRQTREPTVEVAHEALLREWPRLRHWIDEDRDLLVALGQLRDAAAGWTAVDRDLGALYRGARLQVALDATASRTGTLAYAEREFLDASCAARDEEEHVVAATAARQVRVNRRLRAQLVAIAVALVIALGGGVVALDQRGQAEQERRIATARELASASVANLADDPELSILLALEAIETTRAHSEAVRPEAIEALHQAITANRVLQRVPGVGGAVDWSPDGSVFVTEGVEESGVVDIRDAETGDSVITFQGDEVDINDVAFSADSKHLAVAGDEGYLRVFDARTGEELAKLGDPVAPVRGPSFSPDGSRVAAGWQEGNGIRVFDVESGELVYSLRDNDALTTAFSPDGARIVVPNVPDVGIVVADIETGEPLLELDDRGAIVNDLGFSPDGRWLATAHDDGTVRIWGANGDLRDTFSGHTSNVPALDWAPDSTRFATVGADGTARVVELIEGGLREVLTLSSRDSRNGLFGVAFSPDGDRLMTGDGAITAVTVWDVSPLGGAELANFESVWGSRGSGTFTPEGELLVSTPGGGVAIWDIEEGSPRLEIDARSARGDDVHSMALSPDGGMLATSSGGSPAELWDAETGEHLGTVAPQGLDAAVFDLGWSPDGQHLAAGLLLFNTPDDTLGTTVVVDREGTEVSRLIEAPDVYVDSAIFSGDGRSIVTSRVSDRRDPADSGFGVWDWREEELEGEVRATNPLDIDADPVHSRVVAVDEIDGSAGVWDLDRDEPIATFRSSGSLHAVAFRPDGQQVAFAGADGIIGLGDPDTGDQQLVLRGSQSSIRSVSYSPDGTRLASMGTDGILRLWVLDLDELIEIARGKLTRSFEDDECRQWLHLEVCPTR